MCLAKGNPIGGFGGIFCKVIFQHPSAWGFWGVCFGDLVKHEHFVDKFKTGQFPNVSNCFTQR